MGLVADLSRQELDVREALSHGQIFYKYMLMFNPRELEEKKGS